MISDFLTAPAGQGWQRDRGPGWLGVGKDYYLLDGRVRVRNRLALPHVLDLRNRLAPWVRVRVGPRLLQREGDRWGEISGLSSGGVIALSLNRGAYSIVQTTCHELWHECELKMRADILDEIDAEMRPITWGDPAYLDRPSERRARLFDAWCAQIIEGFPPRPPANFLDEIFWHVWSGSFAAEVDRPGRAA